MKTINICGKIIHFAPVGVKCEKSRHQRKDAKRCEKSGKDAKRVMFYGRKTDSAIMYIELNLDHIDVDSQ